MKRVLFVCLGNICRSPMAHGVMLHRVRERGLEGQIEVDSCGTAGYHVGERPDPRTLEVLRKHGIQLDHRGRQLQPSDLDRFDRILTMDRSNLRDARRILGVDADDERVQMVLAPTTGEEVADPYYGGPSGFDRNFEQLSEALDAWLDRLVA